MDSNLFELTKDEMKRKTKIIVGNEKIREQLKEITDNIFSDKNNLDVMEFLDINGNVLLYGRPGTGKTSICYECMLKAEKASYYHLNASTLISEKLGKTAKLINKFFIDVIHKTEKYQVFLLLEEIEAFLPDRTNSKELEDMKRALTIFMHYLDKHIPNLVVLCTTNHKSNLDNAILRRFAFQYKITNSDKNAFVEFLTCKENPFKDNFLQNDKKLKIAELLVENNFTFSDLKHFMREVYISGNEVTANNLIMLIKEEKNEL
jgi:SpoVK/Ycf46/Vps4 family AAA+-type ATPase